MSYKTVNAIRDLSIHATPKFVLWVLADISDDNGYTEHWASTARIKRETGLSNRTVADALAYLVDCKILVIDGGLGKLSRYQINAEKFDQSVKYSPKSKTKVVSEVHQFKGNTLNQSGELGATEPVNLAQEVVNLAQEVVSEVHSIHLSFYSTYVSTNIYGLFLSGFAAKFLTKKHECKNQIFLADKSKSKSQKPKPPSKPKPKVLTLEQACAITLPANVDSELWIGYIEMRHANKKPPTDNAIKLIFEDLVEWGESANQSLRTSIKNSWVGLFPVKPAPQYQAKPQTRTPLNDNSFLDSIINGTGGERDITPKKTNQIYEVGHA